MEIYLDHASTTPLSRVVLDKLNEKLEETYGNPSSLHKKGIEAEKEVKQSRQIISKLLSVNEREIVFTSGGTESNNIAILGALNGNKKGRVLYTSIEHPSVLGPMKMLEQLGYEVMEIPVLPSGIIDLVAFENLLNETLCLVSVMFVNNEVGTVQPIESIGKVLKNRYGNKVLFHVDAVQAFGKLQIEPMKMGIDLMSFSAHKIGGLKGCGGLFIRQGVHLNPRTFGGQQEQSLRPGTENTIGIISMGLAAAEAIKEMSNHHKHAQRLKAKMLDLLEDIPEVQINGDGESPYILNASFLGTKGEILLHTLEMNGVFVATGAACSSKKKHYSHVLKAMGVSESRMESAIRISFGPSVSESDVIDAANAIACAVRDLRSIIGKKRKGK